MAATYYRSKIRLTVNRDRFTGLEALLIVSIKMSRSLLYGEIYTSFIYFPSSRSPDLSTPSFAIRPRLSYVMHWGFLRIKREPRDFSYFNLDPDRLVTFSFRTVTIASTPSRRDFSCPPVYRSSAEKAEGLVRRDSEFPAISGFRFDKSRFARRAETRDRGDRHLVVYLRFSCRVEQVVVIRCIYLAFGGGARFPVIYEGCFTLHRLPYNDIVSPVALRNVHYVGPAILAAIYAAFISLGTTRNCALIIHAACLIRSICYRW